MHWKETVAQLIWFYNGGITGSYKDFSPILYFAFIYTCTPSGVVCTWRCRDWCKIRLPLTRPITGFTFCLPGSAVSYHQSVIFFLISKRVFLLSYFSVLSLWLCVLKLPHYDDVSGRRESEFPCPV